MESEMKRRRIREEASNTILKTEDNQARGLCKTKYSESIRNKLIGDKQKNAKVKKKQAVIKR